MDPTPRQASARTRAVAAGLVVLLLAAAAACSLSDDRNPRALPRDALTLLDTNATVTTPPQGSNPNEVDLYFLNDDHLTSVTTTTSTTPTAQAVFELLLAGPSQSQVAQGLSTSIPVNVTLHRAQKLDDGSLLVDLGPQISLVTGNGAKASYAQMVLTAKGLGFDRVRFQIDGQPIDAPTDEGNLPVVTASDYKPPLNPG